MASTYVNDLRLNEMATGDESGNWGNVTNTNLELVAEAFGFGTEAITTNADTHTTTIADGATDPGRAIFIKYTGTLDSACTITIAPNTINRLHFIENGTSGSQNIIISQGSGANVTIPPGDVKVVYIDGAGSGAAVVDAFASLSTVDLKVQDDLTVTDDATIGGTLGVTGILTCTDDIIIGDGKTIGSASDVDAMTIAANGQITLTQTLIGTALDISGDIDIDGTSNLDVVDIDGAVDMASTLTLAGNADFNGDLDVDGTTNLDVVDIDGAVDMASTLAVTGIVTLTDDLIIGDGKTIGSASDVDAMTIAANGQVTFTQTLIGTALDISGDIDVDGTTNLDVVDIDGALTQDGGAVFNEASADVDFRVESNGNANMLVVDGGNDRVGVGTNTPAVEFEVNGGASNQPALITSSDATCKLGLRDDSTSNTYSVTVGAVGDHLTFTSGSGGSEGMRLTSASKLLIATTSDSTTTTSLFVDGNIAHDGRLLANSTAGNGSASIPGMPVGFDYDTGFYRPASNTIGITTGATERMRISADGLLIGRTDALSSAEEQGCVFFPEGLAILARDGTAPTSMMIFVRKTDTTAATVGSILATSTATTYSTSSDYRLKENVNYDWDATTRLKQLKPARFNFISDSTDTVVDGFLAHEVSSVVPEAVTGDKDAVFTAEDEANKLGKEGQPNYQGIDQGKLVPLLVKTIQELEARITALES